MMQSFTKEADELYRHAGEIEISEENTFARDKAITEKGSLCQQARRMEESARNNRKQFQPIADSGWPVPSSTLFCKAVVLVSKRKMMFSPDQLLKGAAMIMENSPYFFISL